MKLIVLSLFFVLFSCKHEPIPKKIMADYSIQINNIKQFSKQNKYNQKIAFMIDYSLHSGLPRFFVVDLQKNKIIKKGLVCHGNCNGDNNSDYSKIFSNTNNSYCSSLGFALITERAYSKWGKKFKYWLEGLEKTNSNMKSRVVVLHAWKGVPNESIYPESLATSWGCPTVSIDFLDELDIILKKEKKVLLYSFN